jgi:hypothetical protein
MRHLAALLTACAVGLLAAGPAVAEAPAPLQAHGAALPGTVQLRHAGVAGGEAPQPGFAPLGARLAGAGVLSMDVFQYSGAPEAGAEVEWSVSTAESYTVGTGVTNAAGHVDLTGVPGASGHGAIQIWTHDGSALYGLWGLTWPEAGADVGALAPGRIPLTISRSDDARFNDWQVATIRLASHPGTQTHSAETRIASTSSTLSGYALTFALGSETLTYGTVRFGPDEGMELASVEGVNVFPATQPAGFNLAVDERDAQRIWCSPWGSGRPGTSFELVLDGYPALWENEIWGYPTWPQSTGVETLGTMTMTGAGSEKMRLRIPAATEPGYDYALGVVHLTGALTLYTTFQTCTLKPSRATVRSGSSVKLSGVVPVHGHRGDAKGISKSVIVYKTCSAAVAKRGQPLKAGGPAKVGGWTKVAKARANGLGKYATGRIRPARTTWYTVWYPRDESYRAAYTSLTRVTVKR